MISNKDICNVTISCRDDYCQEEDDEDCLLLNKEWKVQPLIVFVLGVPMVLACRDHNISNKVDLQRMMIHQYRQPSHALSSSIPGQLCHAVVKSRTLWTIRCSEY
eukprot:11968783-Ditylum_brightwellii.AAC.1